MSPSNMRVGQFILNEGQGRAEVIEGRRMHSDMVVGRSADQFGIGRDCQNALGFGATSLEDIAAKLDVTKGAFYYHVKNKKEILRLIFLTVLTVSKEPLRRIVETNLPPAEKLRRAADRSPAMIVFYREQPHLTSPFAKEIILRKKAYERYFDCLFARQLLIEMTHM